MTEKLELKINTNIDELKSKINQFTKLAEEIENFKLEITHSNVEFAPHKQDLVSVLGSKSSNNS